MLLLNSLYARFRSRSTDDDANVIANKREGS